MDKLSKLPQTAQTHIWQAFEKAKEELEYARTSTKAASDAGVPARDKHMEEAQGYVRRATNVLFDAFAQEYWIANRSDLQLFLNLLPAICREVERKISCTELVLTVREATRLKTVLWTDRTSLEAKVANSSRWHDLAIRFAVLVQDEHTMLQEQRDRLALIAFGKYEVDGPETGD